MNAFIALSFAIAAQWAGQWTSQDASDAAQSAYWEGQAEGVYIVKEVGSWTCVGIESPDERIGGAPVCTRKAVTEEFLVDLIEEALIEVLEGQGRLLEEGGNAYLEDTPVSDGKVQGAALQRLPMQMFARSPEEGDLIRSPMGEQLIVTRVTQTEVWGRPLQ